jgi:hypothetical protein
MHLAGLARYPKVKSSTCFAKLPVEAGR